VELKLIKAQGTLPADCESVFHDSAIYERYFKSCGLTGSLRRSMEKGELYIAVAQDGTTAGAMEVSMRGFCGLYPYLCLIGVRASFRGQGVGSFLLDELEHMSTESGAKRVTLMVSDFNTGAQELYKRRGYWLLGTLPDAAKDGIAELIMVKDL